MGSDHCFTFDSVLHPSVSQEDCYTTCAAPLLTSIFDGYNATILAYGQTGSGKTFTMGTGNVLQSAVDLAGDGAANKDVGIVPRVVQSVFDEVRSRKATVSGASFTVKVQFLELYGDDLRDLLHREAASKPLAIREDEHGTMQACSFISLTACGTHVLHDSATTSSS